LEIGLQNLWSLEERRVRADLIEVYKIVDGHFFILLRLIISLNLTSLDEQGVILLRVMKTAMPNVRSL